MSLLGTSLFHRQQSLLLRQDSSGWRKSFTRIRSVTLVQRDGCCKRIACGVRENLLVRREVYVRSRAISSGHEQASCICTSTQSGNILDAVTCIEFPLRGILVLAGGFTFSY